MKRLLLAGAVGVVGCVGTMQPKTVSFSPFVSAAFRWGYAVAERSNLEQAFCLYGRQSGDTIRLSRAEYPFVVAATPHSIQYGCRPSWDYIGTAHTHDSRYETNRPCSHSPVDLQTFYKRSHLPSPSDSAPSPRKDLVSIVVCDNEIDLLTRKPVGNR